MISIKTLNEFGRVTRACDMRIYGGTHAMMKAIVDFVEDKEVCGVSVTVNVPEDIDRPTVLWDILASALEPHGIRRVRLTIRSPRHTVSIGSNNFSPLTF